MRDIAQLLFDAYLGLCACERVLKIRVRRGDGDVIRDGRSGWRPGRDAPGVTQSSPGAELTDGLGLTRRRCGGCPID